MNKRINRLLLLLPAMLMAGAGQAQTEASVLMGDANGDGQVTIADVVAVTNKIHGNPPASFVAAAADVNGDGQITIADVVGITNIIHHGSSGGGESDLGGYGNAIGEGSGGWHVPAR